MKKIYKKPGVAIWNKGNETMISNDPGLEKCLKMYAEQTAQKDSGLYKEYCGEKAQYESK